VIDAVVKVKAHHGRTYSRHVTEIVLSQQPVQADRADPLSDGEKELAQVLVCRFRQQRQYLYFCARKASKMRTCLSSHSHSTAKT
jgi:hypothetical protein